MKYLRGALSRALASILLLASFAVAAQQGNTIKLGQSLPLSGPLTELGSEYRDGALASLLLLASPGPHREEVCIHQRRSAVSS